jgi:hypothetical protein
LSFVDGAVRLWREPRVRIAVAVLAFAAVTVVTYLIVHPRLFTGFAAYDDEGYMLTALKGFVNHGELYDRIFTQYGPFYYEAWGGLFSLFGIPVDHDSGRMVVTFVWVLTSLGLGLAAMRITGSLLLGLGTQMLVCGSLWTLATEPMHPGGIICLLLTAIVAISCFVRDRVSVYSMAALGAAVAALLLVKINLGAFALASVALACVVSYPALRRPRWLRPLVELGFVAIPFVLMFGKLGESWARHYAIHVSAAALAAVIVLRARESERRPREELVWLLGGFVLLAVFVCAAIIASGTSFSGLIDGVVRQPLRQADAFTIPFTFSKRLYGVDLLALGAAGAYWYATRRRSGPPSGAWMGLTSLFSVGIGVFMALSVIGKLLPFEAGSLPGYQLSFLAFAWLALITPVRPRPAVSFATLLLPLLAILQALHAYPVAGSQTLWSAFLLIPVGAICVGNGVRGLAALLTEPADRRALGGFAAVAAVVLGWFVVNATLREPLRDYRAAYDAQVPLGLPGAEEVRLSPSENQIYRSVTAEIRRNCTALVMLPGMDSFYIWAQQEPPSGYTATGWPTLFDDAHQRRVIADTRSIEGLCMLRNTPLAEGWGNGSIPSGPLVRYLERGFKPVTTIQSYELFRRPGAAPAARS